jgi:aspartate/methionine/tyrosine aminotransferase
MRLADRMGRLGTESAFEVLARAKALEATGRKVIFLGIGEPDFDTPAHIVEAAERALHEGKTHYVAAAGIPELLEAVPQFLERFGRMQCTPQQVVVSPGAKPIMYYTITALCQQGDEVIYPDPGFPMYESITNFVGAKAVPIPLREENEFRMDPDELESLVTDRTRLIILSSPENPCGSALTKEDCERIAEIAMSKDIMVLTDEVYWAIRYDGKHVSVLDIDGMAERTILLDGWSKTFAMTGWRLGFGVFPEPLVEPVTRLVINTVSCTAAFTQHAAVAALTGPWEPVEAMVAEFRKRRDVMVEGLNGIPGISCVEPGGAFYCFPNITRLGASSKTVEDHFLQSAGVAGVSGTAFGRGGEGYLRLSYANSVENIRDALDAMEASLPELEARSQQATEREPTAEEERRAPAE